MTGKRNVGGSKLDADVEQGMNCRGLRCRNASFARYGSGVILAGRGELGNREQRSGAYLCEVPGIKSETW